MKPTKQIALYTIALIITVSVCATILAQNNDKTITNMSHKIDSLKNDCSALEMKIDNIKINKELLDQIDQLTRDNEQYKITIESQRVEIEAFDEIFD